MAAKKANQKAKKDTTSKTNIEPEATADAIKVNVEPTLEDMENAEELSIKTDLEEEIIQEAIKVTLGETSSCYNLVQKTKELIRFRSAL
jgi:hypothetical protein